MPLPWMTYQVIILLPYTSRMKKHSTMSVAAPDITLLDLPDHQNGGSRCIVKKKLEMSINCLFWNWRVKESSAPNLQKSARKGNIFMRQSSQNNWLHSRKHSKLVSFRQPYRGLICRAWKTVNSCKLQICIWTAYKWHLELSNLTLILTK